MKAKTAKDPYLAEKILAYLTERELGKAHYQRADEILATLVKVAPLDQSIPLNDSEVATITDIFKEDLKVFRTQAISRYEIKVKKA